MPRLTITLPDDLYAMARAHAVASHTSLSKAIADLMQRHPRSAPPEGSAPADAPGPRFHPKTGFPLIEFEEGTTMADIQRSMDDEDVRHLEMMGLSPGEIEKALQS